MDCRSISSVIVVTLGEAAGTNVEDGGRGVEDIDEEMELVLLYIG
jgi:hypothetical protein